MLRRLGQWLGGTRLPGGDSQWTPDWLASAGLPPKRGPVDPTRLAAALRCASILSDALAAQPPHVYQPDPDGGRQRLTGTDVARCLARTSYADWETAFVAAQLTGNGFMRIDRNDRRGPDRLVAIPARLVSVVVADSGVFYEVMADETLGIPEQTLPSADVIHIKGRCIDNAVVGVSPLRAANASIANVVETVGLQRSLFSNLANAGLAFSTEQPLTADQMTELRKRVDAQTKGFAAGGSIILAHGVKIDRGKNASSAHDESLVAALEFSVREIARTFGVPPSMLGQPDTSSYNSAVEERRAFLTATLQPWAARVASELSAKLDAVIEYSFESALLGHGAERAETLSKLVNSGIARLNEARNLAGLPDVEGGDVLRSPVNTFPLDSWLQTGPQETAADPVTRAAPLTDNDKADLVVRAAGLTLINHADAAGAWAEVHEAAVAAGYRPDGPGLVDAVFRRYLDGREPTEAEATVWAHLKATEADQEAGTADDPPDAPQEATEVDQEADDPPDGPQEATDGPDGPQEAADDPDGPDSPPEAADGPEADEEEDKP